ncbi:MAG: hypothetical protein KME52_18390 [Desmonostoc geniculatum HA4340-LM1]|nr:hypothetical protein [Desmonostoc geniculatum HA4340-LM1]
MPDTFIRPQPTIAQTSATSSRVFLDPGLNKNIPNIQTLNAQLAIDAGQTLKPSAAIAGIQSQLDESN